MERPNTVYLLSVLIASIIPPFANKVNCANLLAKDKDIGPVSIQWASNSGSINLMG